MVAAAPPLEAAARALLSDLAAGGRARACGRRPGAREALLFDVWKARLHAFAHGRVRVAVPPE
eukprot:3238400-Alexandrium_andersonii.AAC.1